MFAKRNPSARCRPRSIDSEIEIPMQREEVQRYPIGPRLEHMDPVPRYHGSLPRSISEVCRLGLVDVLDDFRNCRSTLRAEEPGQSKSARVRRDQIAESDEREANES